ncbi:S49 family peptidase [Marinobacter sp. UBA2498]|jgi:signal peptide peptidase SppA|uniref:S49 family peptidase n=1 Tax=Marinobacter sp. UBA2498 TaxID=1946813 RepID=UPI00257CD5EB|nr:S49 family peptidase [Marinobacter sp. UBA2498]|tara:strand:+ start:3652 stop:4584 length:933 start_codon:yes stop_codon:yes gene_type:complete
MPRLINYPHVASMVFGVPLFATPALVTAVKSVLEPRLLGKDVDSVEPVAPLALIDDEQRAAQPEQTASQLAVIPVHGILVPRRGEITETCEELVSYELLRGQIEAARRNEQVAEIVLDFHTGGGSALGCKEAADYIRKVSAEKPITALINFAACSAGYFLASACSRIVASPTAMVGSIGVIIETYDVSRAEEAAGIRFNTFFRGGHKNDASPHEPITDQAVREIEKRLDAAYDLFTRSVAEYRGLDVEAVTATEARVFSAQEALALKLIDEIAPAQDAVNAIASSYRQAGQGGGRKISAQAHALNTQCQL